ncbi:MAG: extracellular solute-binding protein [Lachnospiraceae bacterium]|nr:extracellular solute-binding protein [Lachnospiraceae bacterium]
MHKRKKFGKLSLAAILCVALSGCTEKNPEPETTPTPIPVQETQCATSTPAPPTPTEIPYRNLGGMEIVIGYHFVPEKSADIGFKSSVEVYHEKIMEKYNFHIKKKEVAGWGDMVEAYIESVEEGTPIAQIVELDYRFVAEPMKKGLYYDLATLDELDFSEEKWNDSVREFMTVGDSVYGMKAGASEPVGGVIFNKRLFEEAGLDPNLPYDLQAAGEWTWSKFAELCEILTRDTDGDGQTDVYATVSRGATTLQTLVASAGSEFVRKDEEGILYNNLQSEEVTEALNFAVDLYQKGYEMPQPEGSEWDYFIPAFREGNAAMQFSEVYRCSPGNNYGDCMEDDIGFVMPPKPDGTEGYHSYFCDNIVIIPSCYDEETAGNIAYAYNLYTEMLEADEGGEGWEEKYYSWFMDERAVDETIQYFVTGNCASQLKRTAVEGKEDILGPMLLWQYPFENTTPEEQVKKISAEWDAIIAEVNKSRVK